MSSAEVHEGGCHCGAVRFRAPVDLGKTITCNCSICEKSGSILTFIPAQDFELLSGDAALADYQFGKKVVHHLFCRTCGVRSFGRGVGPDGSKMVAVNVRCLDGVDVPSLSSTPFDGRSL